VEKIAVTYLWVAQYVPEGIGERCLNFEQRLEADFVDLFEGMPIDIRKIFDL
jgi:hypothetical protein